MRNIDELVMNSVFSIHYMPRYSCTFNSERNHYNEVTIQIEALLEKKKIFDAMIAENNVDEKSLGFKNTLDLYNLAENSNQNNTDLAERLLNQYPDLKEYINLCRKLEEARREKNDILTESISFQDFGGYEYYTNTCYPHHAIIKNEDNDLVCAICGATSKDYSLNEEETEFLALCAESQGIFLKEVTKNDMPLLKLLIQEEMQQKQYRDSAEYREALDEELGMAASEELWLSDEEIVSNLRRGIARAHRLDSGIFETDSYRTGNLKYLDEEQAKKILTEINYQIVSLKNSSSKHRDLQLEICRTYKYEVLILSGNRIPLLYDEAKDEDEKVALVKAYFNISNDQYRIESGYFNQETRNIDALFCTCRTAHPEINERLMEMKLKR